MAPTPLTPTLRYVPPVGPENLLADHDRDPGVPNPLGDQRGHGSDRGNSGHVRVFAHVGNEGHR